MIPKSKRKKKILIDEYSTAEEQEDIEEEIAEAVSRVVRTV